MRRLVYFSLIVIALSASTMLGQGEKQPSAQTFAGRASVEVIPLSDNLADKER